MSLTLPTPARRGVAARLKALLSGFRGEGAEARTRRSALFGVGARVFNAGTLLLTHVMLARALGAEAFGLFSLATTWALVLLGFATLGLTMTPQRFAPEYAELGHRAKLAGLYRFAHLVPFLAGLAIALGGLATLRFLPLGLSEQAQMAIGVALLALPALAVIDVIEGFALANDWNDLAYGVTFVLKPLLLPLLFLAMSLSGGEALPAALGGFVLAAWIGAVTLAVLLSRRMRGQASGAAAYEPRRWFGLALPAFLADGAFITMAYADVLILSAHASAAETGVYVAATKIVGVVAFIHFALSYATAHHFSALNAAARPDDLVRYARKAALWSFWPSLGAAILIGLASPWLLGLFGAGFAEGALVVPLLLAALLARAALGPSEQLLLMTDRQGAVTAIFAGAALLNITLAMMLAPMLGGLGVAAATLAANLAAALATAIAVRRAFGGFVHAFGLPASERAEGA